MPGCFSRLSNKFTRKRCEQFPPSLDNEPKCSPDRNDPQSSSDAPEEEAPKKRNCAVKDRWREAFERLPEDKQDILNGMGFNDLTAGSMKSSIEHLVDAVDEKQQECQNAFWKLKVAGKEIVFREYTDQIVGWLEKAGDIAIQFAPPQASLPWGVVKNLMQIPVNESAQMGALLLTTDIVVSVTTRGQVYENVYLPQDGDTILSPVQQQLEKRLVGLYRASLDLLASSSKLLSDGTARRILEAIANPTKATDSLGGLGEQEDALLKDVLACEANRSAAADNRANKMLEALQAPMARVDAGVSHLLNHVSETERIELLEWISPIPFGQHHDEFKEKRTPGTGEWLVGHREFDNWEANDSAGIFWLQGEPGSGKSYLTSKVIDTIRSRINTPPKNEGFAFFYCKRDDRPRDRPLTVLQSFVRQLSTTVRNPKSMQTNLQAACGTARKEGTNFRLEQCKDHIQNSLNIYRKTTLVIDAMDECDPQSRHELVDALKAFVQRAKNPVKIFIASRPDRVLENQLEVTPSVCIEASDNLEDIRQHIDNELNRLAKSNTFLESMKAEIIDSLIERSQGMFQYVSLQVQRVGTGNSPGDVRRRLKALPPSLDEAYDQVWHEIEAQEEPNRSITKRALRWVMASRKPMTTPEILAAVRLGSNGNMLPLDDLVNEQSLLSLCHYFLSIHSQLRVWRFPHLSVREYLETKQGWSMPEAHYYAASVCLSYFVNTYRDIDIETDAELEDQAGWPENTDDTFETLQSNKCFHSLHPFHIYMRHSWVHHVIGAKDIETANLGSLLKSFLGSPNRSSLQYQRWHEKVTNDCSRYSTYNNPLEYYISSDSSNIVDEISPRDAPIFAMCRFALATLLWDWWETAEIDITRMNCNNQNLFEIAAGASCRSICEKLLQRLAAHEADCGIKRQFFGLSLQVAASKGNKEMVQFLLELGADVNAEGGFPDRTALQAAVRKGHEQVVQILLESGADVNVQGMYGTALHLALSRCDFSIVQMLLDRGADVNVRGGSLGNTLVIAASHCSEDLFKLLLDRSTDVNNQGETLGHALVAASERHNEKVAEILLDRGANVNARGDHGTTALQAAACNSSGKLVQMLLDRGANIDALGDYRGNALQAAAYMGHEGVVKMLLDRGANIDAPGKRRGNALQAAAYMGHEGVVKALLDRGADINTRGSDYDTALQAAASEGHTGVIQMLLDRGADINAQGGVYGSALRAAVLGGHEETIQILLDRGADVNAQDPGADANAEGEQDNAISRIVRELSRRLDHRPNISKSGTVLQAASSKGLERTVQVLLARGADVNTQGGEHSTALQAASSEGHEMVVQILLDRGANINAYEGKYGTALQAASSKGHYKVAQILLDRGADVNAQEGEHNTALQAASFEGHGRIVHMLLNRGADVNAQGGEYNTALQAALSEGHKRIVKILLDRGADVNAYGGKCGTPLQAASGRGSEEVVQMLLERGADVNAYGGKYGTALQAASARGSEEVVHILLDQGADVNAHGGEHDTALQAASSEGHEKIVQMLLDRGADVNAYGGEYGTALEAASARGSEEIVRILLDRGADVNAYGGKYGTALQAASARGSEEVVQILLDR
ncbi:ankyrin repeat-containing domain protein, partial [Aspergillus novoparasiticus]